MDYYLQKTYYKTASLISSSCKAIALLAGHTAEVSKLAYDYGRNLVCYSFFSSSCFKHHIHVILFVGMIGTCTLYQGLAFQLVDDILDFTGTSASLGKGSLSDIRHVYFFRFPHLLSYASSLLLVDF